ncbi:ATP-binding protein [Streptomyces virens]|uniref:Anti-sigma regulatory factor (Ser/Thr protein kinase) n=2 Tax=Streptomyces TaxID=1883 RepID=A0AA40SG22_9ACTN|nr:anti-sigma regulatory factor (Ser/Thr protein kinase) [Streptomyces calvus]MBA8979963.1 anti-sigma regulatory factor (Ser/Thr protein kinase) [Streptomyces calvus]GGP60228.1 ATPase [Streptomyces calvus]
MSSPAYPVLRPPIAAMVRVGDPGTTPVFPYGPLPAAPHEEPHSAAAEAAHTASDPVVLRIARGPEGLARARSFTRDTLRDWSLGHRCDDATLVMTELAANAVTHAAPRCAGAPDVRLGFRLEPAHLLLTVSDPDDRAPVLAPGAGSGLEEHGRGLHIVDALSEAWGWTPTPPAGKTVWARLSTSPPT